MSVANTVATPRLGSVIGPRERPQRGTHNATLYVPKDGVMYWPLDHADEEAIVHPEMLTTPQAGPTCPSPVTAAPLFPPRDADVATFHAWLARAAWPEVVFGARLPVADGSRRS